MNAAQIIKQHYQMNRMPTQAEVDAEIANLQRKKANGTLDDGAESLAIRLRVEVPAQVPET